MSEIKVISDEELIDQFRIIKEVEEGLANSSLNQYLHDLTLFSKFTKKPLIKVTTRDIRAFLVHLKRDKDYKKT